MTAYDAVSIFCGIGDTGSGIWRGLSTPPVVGDMAEEGERVAPPAALGDAVPLRLVSMREARRRKVRLRRCFSVRFEAESLVGEEGLIICGEMVRTGEAARQDGAS